MVDMSEKENYLRMLKKLRAVKPVRVSMHLSMYEDGWLRIHEVDEKTDRLGKCLVDVSDDEEDTLYRRAAGDIRMILKWEKEKDEKEK